VVLVAAAVALVLAVVCMGVASSHSAPTKIDIGELKVEIENTEKKEVRSTMVHSRSSSGKASPPSTTGAPSFYEGDSLKFSFSVLVPAPAPAHAHAHGEHGHHHHAAEATVLHPQQVFFSFSHPALDNDLVFVASPSSAAAAAAAAGSSIPYHLTVVKPLFPNPQLRSFIHSLFPTSTSTSTLMQPSSAFKGFPGDYSACLIVADPSMEPLLWQFGSLKLVSSSDSKEPGLYDKLPEIEHIFRKPEIQPPLVISLVFSAIVLAILVILPFLVS